MQIGARWLRNIVSIDVFRPVSSDEAERWLGETPSKDLIDQIYAFGTVMLGEVAARTSALDSKANALLGWSLAVLAGLLAGSPVWVTTNSWLVVAGVVVTLVAATASGVLAALAMRLQGWTWPSEEDWFRQELFTEPNRLKTYHGLAMLEAHQGNSRINISKGRLLRGAQFSLSVATVVVGLLATIRVASVFFAGLGLLP